MHTQSSPPARTARSIALAVLALCSAQASAEDAPAAKPAEAPKKAEQPIQSVEVKGTAADYDPRRDDTASKTVLNNEEIMKYGDSNVLDVLKRAPGVTVIGNSIRMRGLGNGYTQILVNGDRPPPGFSMDTLTPDQIEKIEIVRAATAEYSMQAVAGTINIILKRVVAKPQRDLRVTAMHSPVHDFGAIGGTIANKAGNLSWFLNATLQTNLGQGSNASSEQGFSPAGVLLKSRSGTSTYDHDMDSLSLSPRLNWKLPNGDDLNVQFSASANRIRSEYANTSNLELGVFQVPHFAAGEGLDVNRTTYLSGEINWIARLAGGKLDLKVSGSGSERTSERGSISYTAERTGRWERQWDTDTSDRQGSVNLKFSRPLFDGHALSTGVEAHRLTSTEDLERAEWTGSPAAHRADDRFEPTVVRLAGYLQDEWNITKQWSVYLGARWEQIRTDSVSASSDAAAFSTHSRNQVLSPVAQTLYKFPDKSGRQLRLALTRTFKAPTTQQLTARRYEALINDEFAPDFGGNPALRAELANGVDLTYEHFFAPGALFSVGAAARSIDDYIRMRLGRDAAGRWVYQPQNAGKAHVRSLEMEFKAPLKAVMPSAPPVDVRFSVNRNWSEVDSVPGPDNRLDGQTPLSANLGADYRLPAWNMGANLSYRRGGWVRISAEESQLQQSRRNLEAYALWKFRPGYQLRMSVSDALKETSRHFRQYEDQNSRRVNSGYSDGHVRFGVNLEVKL